MPSPLLEEGRFELCMSDLQIPRRTRQAHIGPGALSRKIVHSFCGTDATRGTKLKANSCDDLSLIGNHYDLGRWRQTAAPSLRLSSAHSRWE
ncbi:hypothetical protein CEXT_559951 [Caerostris extrusa]|uniref:Uncharacterized protein n=1 Tax=Caerostris extrusa TaxID=172846 RepID=A0AAV4VQ61_CAEEX|nr:hypothetical protein CEXT_559951 [Caerostris extrusa]